MKPTELAAKLQEIGLRSKDLAPLLGVSLPLVNAWRIGARPIPRWLDFAMAQIERDIHAQRLQGSGQGNGLLPSRDAHRNRGGCGNGGDSDDGGSD